MIKPDRMLHNNPSAVDNQTTEKKRDTAHEVNKIVQVTSSTIHTRKALAAAQEAAAHVIKTRIAWPRGS